MKHSPYYHYIVLGRDLLCGFRLLCVHTPRAGLHYLRLLSTKYIHNTNR